MWFNKSQDIIGTMMDEAQWERETFRTAQAEEGNAFYNNTITSKMLNKRYYPPSRFSGTNPLISMPVTKEIINRIMGAFRSEVTGVDDKQIEELYKKYNINKLTNRLVKNSLVLGSTSLWLTNPMLGINTTVTEWKPWFTYKSFASDGNTVDGYIKHYVVDNRTILPPLNAKRGKGVDEYIEFVNDTTWTIWKNDVIIYDEAHGLPFTPVVWYDSIDMDEDERYGKPFFLRFKNILIALNQLITNANRQTLALPTMWTTSKITEDGEEIIIRPDIINYIGPDSELKQTTRNVDLSPEEGLIATYLDTIYSVSMLPPKEILSGVGKVEHSGVALKLLFKQFELLINDMTMYYIDKEVELVEKLYYFEYEKELKDFNINYLNDVTPDDKAVRFALDKQMLDAGLVSIEDLKVKWEL
jgi:hypothetical protein